MARVEDANRHLGTLNRLYLSTIETLAMAIDAKDQVTHGHIRRVQSYAVGLATELGISDDGLLRAIEASALLHDMGKLAIPEHILNKPGKLTAGEFEKMKLHAAIGADLLSAIEFPYPVVPIVRHHHENWDGSGYPDGLAGTQIPVAARILAVVDCFDALTSDRPYRPALSDETAAQILRDRRGTMYDPLVVDKFLEVYRALTPNEPQITAEQRQFISHIAELNHPESESVANKSTADKHSQNEFDRAVRSITEAVRPLVGSLELMICAYEDTHASLRVKHLSSGLIGQTRLSVGDGISVGDRVTGWVASTHRRVLNSDAALDAHGTAASDFTGTLVYCSAFPLQIVNAEFVGVFTIYTSEPLNDPIVGYIELILPRVSLSTYRSTAQHVELEETPKELIERFAVEQKIRAAFGVDPSTVTIKTRTRDPQPFARDLLMSPDSPVLLTDVVLAGSPNEIVVISPREDLRSTIPRWAQSRPQHKASHHDFVISEVKRLSA